MKINGHCHCGELQYTAEVEPELALICHCTDCQLLSGSAFRSLVLSKPDAFTFTSGTPSVYVKTAESGSRREQTFCPTCGSPIYSAAANAEPRSYAIRLGTVVQRDQLVPRQAIWCRSAQQWIRQIADLPESTMQ